MFCPLCSSTKLTKVCEYDLNALRVKWEHDYGFDPFPAGFNKNIVEHQCFDCCLFFYAPMITGDSDFYEKLSVHDWYYEQQKWEFDAAIKHLIEKKPDSLLEIGCGSGLFLDKICTAIKHVEGVELNEKAIEECKRKGLNVSSKKIEDFSEKFDVVVMFQVLEHLESPAELINKSVALLNPGGLLIISVPNPSGYLNGLGITLLGMPPHHVTAWTEQTFDYIAAHNKLNKVFYGQEPLRYEHYIGYLEGLLGYGKHLNSKFDNFFFKMKRSLLKMAAPLFFNQIRQTVHGHTHLVVFKNE